MDFVLHKTRRLVRRVRALARARRFARVAKASAVLVDPAARGVVSLTTYGSRLETVHLTIESIGRGTMRPRRLILWVDEGVSARLPEPLVAMVERGLEIVETESRWGPHKKYYPYCVAHAGDEDVLVTADDDVFYQPDWLRDLLVAQQASADIVWCHRARAMRFDASGAMRPYAEWPLVATAQPKATHLATGVGGVAYPPALQRVLRDAGEGFVTAHARTDDIWLHQQAVRAGYRIGQVAPAPADNVEIVRTQRTALLRSNQTGHHNDEVLAVTYSADELGAMRHDDRGRQAAEREPVTAAE